jgi:protein-disulfide isomerase
MDRRFLAILGVIVVFFVGLVFWNTNKGSTSTTSASPTNNVTGKLDSKVTFLEYGDFQCNACQAYNSTVDAVRAKYADTVKFQFRNLPLPSLHPNAIGAARAAEAAAKQGKFWQMHDALYKTANWQVWTTASDPNSLFQQYAQQIGLNITQFKKDFISSSTNDTINADIAAFQKTGKDMATPTFFINGTYIPLTDLIDANGSPSVDAFSKYLDAELAKVSNS